MTPPRHAPFGPRFALLFGVVALVGTVSPATVRAQATPPAQPSARRARVAGIVTDVASKQPLPGVNVFIVGTPIVASTGPDGRFAIPSAPVGIYSIEVKRIGYSAQRQENIRLTADNVTTVDFTMSTAATRLDQVTVSGTMDATSVAKSTISVEKLSSENIPVPPTSSAAGLLAGKVAGVAVTRNSGAPGAGVNIVLRTPISGITEGGGTPGPLFVVDGVFLNQGQSVTTQDIESMDIESIEVIKGAAAASLYGSRAAAGVIAISTKRGKGLALGTNQFQARGEAGTDQFLTKLDKNQHHAFRQDAQGNWLNATNQVVPRAQRALTDFGIMDQPFAGKTYNHADLFFKPGSYNSQQLQVQGNLASTNYNLAYTRTDNPAILEFNEGYTRHTVRLNLDSRLSEKLNVGMSVNYTRGQQDVSGPSFNNFYRIDTDVNLQEKSPFPAVNGFPFVIVPDSVTLYTNPLYSQYIGDNVVNRGRTLLNANGVYRPTSWFSIAGDVNYDRGDNNQTSYTPRGTPLVTTTGGLSPSTGALSVNTTGNEGFIGTLTGSLTKGIGDLTIRLSQRGEVRQETNNSLTTNGSIFSTEGLKAMSQATVRTTSNSYTDYRVLGSITSLGLSLKERYITDFLVRREGNSLFGPANRWNTFGRASAAWLLSEESWFPMVDFNVFKLRYSYGVTGLNPAFSNQYESMSSDGTGAIRRGTLGNVNISPTFTTEQEIGLDLAYKSRFSGTVTYVRNSSQDVFVNVPAPVVSGYQVQVTNPAHIGGSIIELTLQGAVLSNPKGLRWDVLFTGDKSWNYTEKFGRTCFDDGLQYKCDGVPVSEMWGNMIIEDKSHLPAIHANSQDLFQVNDEGYVVPVGAGNTWRDGISKRLWGTTVNIDGVNYAWGRPIPRRTPEGILWYGKIGDSRPDFRYGFQNNFRYGNLRFYVQMNGQLGGNVYANSNQTYYASGDHPVVDQFGKPDELKKPVAYYNAVSNNNNLYLKRFVESGTHLQVAEMMIGYTMESSKYRFIERLGFSRAQFDLIGRNLGVFTNYTGLNVMAGSPTVRFDDATYPQTRTLTGVLTLAF
ncbi:MAG: SusC/RagA family TonB-linked outer membrane protein [Gemmatimonadaceae bacterium]|nr:SusC/RagA family TonB-linked outer membrane protein [Gemmatimonadaceae bacterium]